MPQDPAALAPTDADRFQRFLDRAAARDEPLALLAQRAALRQELQRIKAAAELWLGRLGQARPLGTPRPGGRLPAGLPPSGSKTGF